MSFENSTINASLYSPMTTQSISRNSVMIWFWLSTIISIVGASASTLLISALCLEQNIRKGSNILICHLLMVELTNIIILTNIAHTVLFWSQLGHQFYANCAAFMVFQLLFTDVGNWSAACLAINRFVAIIFPHRYKQWLTRKALCVMISMSWILGIVCSLPPVFGVGAVYMRFFPGGYCGTRITSGQALRVLMTFGSTIPLAVQGICYAIMFVKMVQRKCKRGQSQLTPNQRRHQMLALMLAASFLWYLVCFLPIPVLFTYFPGFSKGQDLLFCWLRTLLLCGFVGTPFILIFMSADYKIKIKQVISNFKIYFINFTRIFSINRKNFAVRPSKDDAAKAKELQLDQLPQISGQ